MQAKFFIIYFTYVKKYPNPNKNPNPNTYIGMNWDLLGFIGMHILNDFLIYWDFHNIITEKYY